MHTHKTQGANLIKPGSRIDQFLTQQFGSTMFTYQAIFAMLLPLILDQFFINLISLLTTAMISSSSQESVSAISLINPMSMMIFAVFNAISAGGTVIVAQYKGCGDTFKLRIAAGQVMFTTTLVAVLSALVLIVNADSLVHFMFSSADPLIIQKARDYLIGVAISLVFLSLYLGVFAVFRGIGESKMCLRLTILINLIHLFASMFFINGMHLDIIGTTLSLNIARFIGGVVAIYMLMGRKSILRVSLHHIFHIDGRIIKQILHIGFPFALEQLFFNGGSMIVQTYIVKLGTTSVAANAVANSAFAILYSAGLAVGTLSITLIGQCAGAGHKDLVKRYGKKMIGLGTGMVLLSILLLFPLMPFILRLYQAPPETMSIIYSLLLIAVIPMPFFWSVSNVMPCVLRAAGDANFSSIVSLLSMWLIRVGLAYLFALPFGLGVQGVWICMGIEWAVRTVIFLMRYHSEKWLYKKTI
ncbi:MAG: MATE family efflux transporter [Lachnospiraceae bacterium]